MNIANDNARREETILTLADGKQQTIAVNGDFFYIENITASIRMNLNGGTFATITDGDSMQTPVNRGYIQTLTFLNNSGAECVITVVHGIGEFARTANATIQNPNFTLSSAQVTDLKQVTVSPTTGTENYDGQTITTNGVTLTGKRFVAIENTHASVNLTVQFGSYTRTLTPSQVWQSPLLAEGKSLSTITVNASGSNAEVEYLNA